MVSQESDSYREPLRPRASWRLDSFSRHVEELSRDHLASSMESTRRPELQKQRRLTPNTAAIAK